MTRPLYTLGILLMNKLVYSPEKKGYFQKFQLLQILEGNIYQGLTLKNNSKTFRQ